MGTSMLVIVLLLIITGIAYIALIGLFTFGWYRAIHNNNSNNNDSEKVSVVVAARNEEIHILDLLDDILQQDYPGDLLEIIVVDDHSSDKTHKIVSGFIEKHPIHRIVLLKNEDFKGSGKKAALDLGINHSTGGIIITTDADCRVGPGWVSTLAAFFEDADKVMVFGPVCYFPGKGLMNRFQSFEFSGLMASGAGAAGAGHPFLCNGASLAYRKSAFQEVNGFEGNERFISGDDVFLMHKMKKAFGRKAIGFARDKRSLVQTYPAPGFPAFLKQRIRWASKSKGYKDPFAMTTALIVFAFNFVLSATFIAGMFYPGILLLFTGFILLKSLIDLPLMWGVTGFNHTRQHLLWYLPFQLIYPFYVLVAGIGSLFPRREW